LSPLSQKTKGNRVVFYQDLSWVPARLMPLYLRQFERDTSRQPSWGERTLDDVALTVRTSIARLADEQKVAAPALVSFIRLLIVPNTQALHANTAAPPVKPVATCSSEKTEQE
jgi:hypothetical protein